MYFIIILQLTVLPSLIFSIIFYFYPLINKTRISIFKYVTRPRLGGLVDRVRNVSSSNKSKRGMLPMTPGGEEIGQVPHCIRWDGALESKP